MCQAILRLKELIFSLYEADGGIVEGDILYLGKKSISLAPIFGFLRAITSEKSFTHLPPLLGSDQSLPIPTMYVELTVSSNSIVAEPKKLSLGLTLAAEQEEKHAVQFSKRVSVIQAVENNSHNHLVILGDPGCGKTSMMKYLSLTFANGGSDRWVFPIFISLTDYWNNRQFEPQCFQSLIDYASMLIWNHGVQNGEQLSSSFNRERLSVEGERDRVNIINDVLTYLSGNDKEHVIFLLDGFDEIATSKDAVEHITYEINKLSAQFSWMLTSRKTGFFGGVYEDVRYEVVGLHQQSIEKLVINWFAHGDKEYAERNRNDLLRQISENTRLLNMARNPFLLTLLCYLQQYFNHSLPLQRSQIYKNIIDLIRKQYRSEQRNENLLTSLELTHLSDFCFFLYTEAPSAPLQLFDRDLWEQFTFPNDAPSLDEHYLKSRLITTWKVESYNYHLIHLTFQEYLIAVSLSNRPFDDVIQYLHKPYWRVVIRFLSGIYWTNNEKDKYIKLLQLMLNQVDHLGLLYIDIAWLLVEAGIENSTHIIGYDLCDKLWDKWYSDVAYLSDAAGEALAVLCPSYIMIKVQSILRQSMMTHDGKEHEIDINGYKRKSVVQRINGRDPALLGIKLLAKVHLQEVDEMLIDLLNGRNVYRSQAATKAIIEKNTPELRQQLIELADDCSDSLFKSICFIAKKTRHSNFLPWVEKQISLVQNNTQKLQQVCEVIEAMQAEQFEPILYACMQQYPPNQTPEELLRAYISLDTKKTNQWLNENMHFHDSVNHRVVMKAIELDLLADDQIIKYFDCDQLDLLKLLIRSIGDRADNGYIFKQDLVAKVADIVYLKTEISDIAFSALCLIEGAYLSSNKETGINRQFYRDVLNGDDVIKLIDVILLLGELKDVASYERIKYFALSGSSQGIRVVAISSLVYFVGTHRNDILNLFREILNIEDDNNSYITKVTLDSIGKIDMLELRKLDDSIALENAKARACAEQGILLFDDKYIDVHGETHYLNECDDDELSGPFIDRAKYNKTQTLPALSEYIPILEFQYCIITVIEYLVNSKKIASYMGKYKRGRKTIPIFRKQQDNSDFVDSIDRKTGTALIKGEVDKETKEREVKYLSEPRTADKLVNWILHKFPIICELAEQAYRQKLIIDQHNNHIIIGASYQICCGRGRKK